MKRNLLRNILFCSETLNTFCCNSNNSCEYFYFENLLLDVVKDCQSVAIFSRSEECKYFIHVECHVVSVDWTLENNIQVSIKFEYLLYQFSFHPIRTNMEELRNWVTDCLDHEFVQRVDCRIEHDLTPFERRIRDDWLVVIIKSIFLLCHLLNLGEMKVCVNR